ncbi:OprO/OprP family phosphate-selective porin [Parabacteroides sp. OttesenSCG-928-G06]|nr:OprO/OprP family phosphate-selective porin [Parabacteroides sp. OttesenSCG-928-G06]
MKVKILVYVFLFLSLSFMGKGQTAEEDRITDLQQRLERLEKDMANKKGLSVSGYIQGQYQWGEESASLKVGGANEKADGSFNRIGIRRGRIKVGYTKGIVSGVFQIDMTEKGVGVKDAFLAVKDPWFRTSQFKGGIMDQPFGYEIGYSSSTRESPERSTVFQLLFPEARDLGVMLSLQPAKTSPLSFLKLDAGLFSGNGVKQDVDSRKDFIAHLSAQQYITMNLSVGLGISLYEGSVYQGTGIVYKMEDGGFVLDDNETNIGKYARREYFGFDAQLRLLTTFGTTSLHGEYLWGQQPGTAGSSKSPNSSSLPAADTYIRPFNGWYLMLTQEIGQSPFSLVLKYDVYDPNTKVSGDRVGANHTGKTDLEQQTWGLGGLWNVTSALRLQAYYEINRNETTSQLERWKEDVANDVFTLRLQYKF